MKVTIKLHEKETKANYYQIKKVILYESFECSEAEFNEIRAQYESKLGKYGMQNSSLDRIQYI